MPAVIKNNSAAGFTLIEIMVVVSIISLLASVATVSLNQGRIRAIDAQRITAVHELQTALESYYDDHQSFPYITTSSSYPLSIITSADPEWQTLASYLVPRYIAAMPTLPITWTANDWHQDAYVVSFSTQQTTSANGSHVLQWISNKQMPYQYTCMSPNAYQVGVSLIDQNDPSANTKTGYGANNYGMDLNFQVFGGTTYRCDMSGNPI